MDLISVTESSEVSYKQCFLGFGTGSGIINSVLDSKPAAETSWSARSSSNRGTPLLVLHGVRRSSFCMCLETGMHCEFYEKRWFPESEYYGSDKVKFFFTENLKEMMVVINRILTKVQFRWLQIGLICHPTLKCGLPGESIFLYGCSKKNGCCCASYFACSFKLSSPLHLF